MDNRKIIIIILSLMTIVGCASIQNFIPPWRKPGEKLLDVHEEVWKDYNCRYEKLPIVKIEENELVPKRLNPTKEMKIDHRLVYGLCCNLSLDDITGQLFTRIYHDEKIVVNDISRNYTLKPGRWQVDTFIKLPEEAQPGVYTLEIEFDHPNAGFKVDNTFIVEGQDE